MRSSERVVTLGYLRRVLSLVGVVEWVHQGLDGWTDLGFERGHVFDFALEALQASLDDLLDLFEEGEGIQWLGWSLWCLLLSHHYWVDKQTGITSGVPRRPSLYLQLKLRIELQTLIIIAYFLHSLVKRIPPEVFSKAEKVKWALLCEFWTCLWVGWLKKDDLVGLPIDTDVYKLHLL